MDEIQRLWAEHTRTPFPADCRGEQIEGIELVLLDADIAGCVSTFLGSSGRLDDQRIENLVQCKRHIDLVLLQMKEPGLMYFARLRDLAQAVLARLKPSSAEPPDAMDSR
jgi:hypothetical protein